MRWRVFTAICGAFLLAACSMVSTHVVQFDPSRTYTPTQNVEVLLEKPKRPYIEIALLESRGEIGVTEPQLLNDARDKARAVGADAIVRIDSERVYHPPVAVYDPWSDAFYWRAYGYRPLPPFAHPWGGYRVIGGGFTETLKAIAIKYGDAK